MNHSIPVAILQNLRCGHCRKYVNCGPVHVAPDSSILCGRCHRFSRKTYRNYAFEALASIYVYPCHYWPKHCNKRLVWNEALNHERKCLFQSSCNVFCSRPTTFFKSDRKLNSSDVKTEHVADEILQQLKCASCALYLSNAPTYLLVDGQNICHRCVHSNGPPHNSIRNLAYETIASSIIFPCVYRFRGCTFRLQFGRDIWAHESDCPYGQIQQKLVKKPSKLNKDGKERGVIETHSGHIWGTITPHSSLFSPPRNNNNDGKLVTQEIEGVLKKKQLEEIQGFDAQSLDSVMSKSTLDSLDYLSKTGDVSRDNISRSTIDNISRSTIDNISRSSSRMNVEDYRRVSNDAILELHRASGYSQEVAPLPTPPGYNKIPYNGYYQETVTRFARPSYLDQHLYHYPPILYENPQANSQIAPQRSESFRVGNQEIIDELRVRQKHRESMREESPYKACANLQDLVQKHDEVAN